MNHEQRIAELEAEQQAKSILLEDVKEFLTQLLERSDKVWHGNRAPQCQENYDKAQAILAKLITKPKGGVFVPEEHEKYWVIDAFGAIYQLTNNQHKLDIDVLSIGNCYRTRQEAETVVLNRKIHRFLQEQTDFVPDWGDDNDKAYLRYDHDAKRIVFGYGRFSQLPSQVYFAPADEIRIRDAAITKFGEQAVIGYLTGGLV